MRRVFSIIDKLKPLYDITYRVVMFIECMPFLISDHASMKSNAS